MAAEFSALPSTPQSNKRTVSFGVSNVMRVTIKAAVPITPSNCWGGDYLGSMAFVTMATDTTEDDVPVVDTNLAKFDMLPQNRRDELVKKTLDVLPAEMIAHRFGDFVFVHHGIDMNNCDPWLWLVILSPDPDTNTVDMTGSVMAGLCSGTAMSLDGSTFTIALAEQNNIRAKHNLPPLPDPRLVTHAKPVVAGGSP